MGTIQGLITSYDVKENKVDVSNVLSLLQMPATPLLNRIGFDTKAVTGTRHEWWDDVLPALKVPVTAAYTAGAGKLIVEDAKKIKVGNVLKVEDSIYRVTAINTSTNELTIVVVSSDANHAAGVDAEIISDANPEADEYKDSNYEPKIKRFNVTQIFDDYIKISGTQKAVQQYVEEDVFLDEVQRKLEKMK